MQIAVCRQCGEICGVCARGAHCGGNAIVRRHTLTAVSAPVSVTAAAECPPKRSSICSTSAKADRQSAPFLTLPLAVSSTSTWKSLLMRATWQVGPPLFSLRRLQCWIDLYKPTPPLPCRDSGERQNQVHQRASRAEHVRDWMRSLPQKLGAQAFASRPCGRCHHD
jgi:hypothetical protein